MSFYPPSSPGRSFEAALAPLLHDDGLPFADVLPAEQVRQACLDEGVHFGACARAVYNPAVVLWAFLSQVLGADKSCRAAALRVLVLAVVLQRGPCSSDTGLYCRARAKLPAALLRRLTYDVADQLETQATISDDTFDQLYTSLGRRNATELVFILSFYCAVARFSNGTRAPIEADDPLQRSSSPNLKS